MSDTPVAELIAELEERTVGHPALMDRAAAALRALSAENEGLRREREWRPIGTAPKSTTTPTKHGNYVKGIYILGFCPEEGASPQSCICVVWWEPHENNNKGAWMGEGGFPVKPTHWQPLPPPPATEAGS